MTVLSVALLAGCGATPGGGAPGGGVAGGGGGGAASIQPPPAAASTSTYPLRFSGTIAGTNGVDSWSGTATVDRLPDTDECNQDGAFVCYGIAGGSVTWTVSGVSKTIQLGPSTAADGIVVIVADSAHPSHNGSYEISLAPTTEISIDTPTGPRYAFETVRDWLDVVDFPKVTADWHLAGQSVTAGGCGIDGCGSGQTWTWDLQGTFGP